MSGRLAETVQRVNNGSTRGQWTTDNRTDATCVTVGGKPVITAKVQQVLDDLVRFDAEYCTTHEMRSLHRALMWLRDRIQKGEVPL